MPVGIERERYAAAPYQSIEEREVTVGVLQFAEQGIDDDPAGVVNRQQQRELRSVFPKPICGSCRLPGSACLHAASAADELCASEADADGGCSHRHSPVGDAVCCALCLCLRVHSTTRSYECGWFPNTVCAPDATQWSSLLPMSHWALYWSTTTILAAPVASPEYVTEMFSASN